MREVFGFILNIRYIEKGFVNGDLFHQTSGRMENIHYLLRDFAVDAMMPGHDDQPRAESERFAHRHGAPYSHRTRSIGAGCHNSAFIRFATHSKGFTAEFGIARLFYSAVESVQVKVQN